MIGGLQGEFGDLDIKYLKQNISKFQSDISGSFRRTPRHCAEKYLKMSVGHIEKLQDNTVALYENGCETLRVSAIRGSGYVWPGKLKRPLLPSGIKRRMRNIRMECRQSKIPNVRHPGGMCDATAHVSPPFDGVSGRIPYSLHSGFAYGKGLQSFGSFCFWAFHFFTMDSKELSSISDCFGDKKAIKTPKLDKIWLELITRVLNMLIGLKGDNYYSKVFKRVNYKLWNSTFWVVINLLMVFIAFHTVFSWPSKFSTLSHGK